MKSLSQSFDCSRIKRIFLLTFSIGLVAHGYCFLNTLFSHDCLLAIDYTIDIEHQLLIGRFLRPLYILLRSPLEMPWINGLLSLLFFSVAIYFIIELFQFKSPWSMGIAVGILITNFSVTALYATYLHDADCYAFALMLVTLGVWLLERKGKVRWFAPLLFFISLGLYQAYIQVAVVLVLLCALCSLLDGEDIRDTLYKLGLNLLVMAAAMLLYFLVYRAVRLLFGIDAEVIPYNSPENAISFSIDSLVSRFYSLFQTHVVWVLSPCSLNTRVIAAFNLILILLTAYLLVCVCRNAGIRKKRLAAVIFVLALIPLGMGCIAFVSNCFHELLRYSYFIYYLIAFLLLERIPEQCYGQCYQVIGKVVGVLLLLIVFDNIIYSNACYVKKSLELQETNLVMTRVLDRIEQTDGYEVGETPVVFVGQLLESVYNQDRENFPYNNVGLYYNFSITYNLTFDGYFTQYLNYPIEIIPVKEWAQWENREEVAAMSPFPAADSCQIIDGVMVVKLSEAVEDE